MSNLPKRRQCRSEPEVEQRKLSDLRPFPLQTQLEGTTTPFEDAELADDIEQHGLREPIQILPRNKAGLPENTILDGHRRKAALTASEEKEVAVDVRYDLANAERETIYKEFYRIGLMRRHPSPLVKARFAKGLIESERGSSNPNNGEVRDRIGKWIGMSGRHLDRFLSVLRTPLEIQTAFENKKLSLMEADKVSRLTEDKQSQIAQRIHDGELPREVVTKFFPKQRSGHKKPNDAFVAFMKMLRRGIEDLADRANRVSPNLIVDYEDDLRGARKLFRALLDRRPPSPEEETAGW